MAERRYLQSAELRVEENDEGGAATIGGYAVLYNERSQLLWDFYEEIARGAFGGSLSGDVRALWQHNADQVLGRTRAGTLAIWDDERGVAFRLTPPETTLGRDAVESIRRGDIDQMSFGFTVSADDWTTTDDGAPLRTVRSAELIEISPVTWAAYPQTEVGVRAIEIYGDQPMIPDNLRAQGSGDNSDDTQARARWAYRNRQIHLGAYNE